MSEQTIQAKRAAFPAGLRQEKEGFRFGLDALLLAGFTKMCLPVKTTIIAELGCGCGAALIALCLVHKVLFCLGFENNAQSLDCARQNLKEMGLEQQIRLVNCDISLNLHCYTQLFQAVLANPPFYDPSEGRHSKTASRDQALRSVDALDSFCKAAHQLLVQHGHFFVIYPAKKIQQLCKCLEKHHFGIRILLPIAPREKIAASRILVAARKNAKPETELLFPLILHEVNSVYTAECLDFCPWLKK